MGATSAVQARVDGTWRNLYIKDGACYCYCAYVLRISRYSGFLWVVPTNTGIFLRALKLCGENRTKEVLLVSKKKIGVTMHFSEIIKLKFGKKRHCFICYCFFRIIVALLSQKKCVVPPFWISIALTKNCFLRIVIKPYKKTSVLVGTVLKIRLIYTYRLTRLIWPNSIKKMSKRMEIGPIYKHLDWLSGRFALHATQTDKEIGRQVVTSK